MRPDRIDGKATRSCFGASLPFFSFFKLRIQLELFAFFDPGSRPIEWPLAAPCANLVMNQIKGSLRHFATRWI